MHVAISKMDARNHSKTSTIFALFYRCFLSNNEILTLQVIYCLWSTLFALTKNLEGEAAVAAKDQIYTFLGSCVPAATKQVALQKHIILSILEINSKHVYVIIKNILASNQADHE